MTTTSFRPMFTFTNEKAVGNGQRFATQDEALASASARFQVWTMPTGFFAEESADPVNYRHVDGHDLPLES